jgi:hypothetical protein
LAEWFSWGTERREMLTLTGVLTVLLAVSATAGADSRGAPRTTSTSGVTLSK